MNSAWFAIMAVMVFGCGRSPAPPPQTPSAVRDAQPVTQPEAPKSSVSAAIDGITGKTAVEAGKRARVQIEKVGAQEQHDINEAMQP